MRVDAIGAGDKTVMMVVDQPAVDAVVEPLPPPAGERASLHHLPRRAWWRLLGDLILPDAALASALYAVEQVLLPASLGAARAPLDAGGLLAIHELVTRCGRAREPGFLPPWSLRSQSHVMAVSGRHTIDAAALGELRREGVAAYLQRNDQVPDDATAAILAAGRPIYGDPPYPVTYQWEDFRPLGGALCISVTPNFMPGAAEGFAARVLRTYHDERARIAAEAEHQVIATVPAWVSLPPAQHARMLEAATGAPLLTAIARAVRALHTGHVFADGDAAIDTVVVLNRLLIDAQLSPAIVADPGAFGGRETLATLVEHVRFGQDQFQHAVQLAHAANVIG